MSLEPTLKHLSQRELSERWTIAETTLERWRSMGIGPVYVKLPGRVVYRITDVECCRSLKIDHQNGVLLVEN